jgi:hypothetical protein
VLHPYQENTIPVSVEHLPDDHLIVASLHWPIAQPEDTYTIDVGEQLSLELDKHFPVRPSHVAIHDQPKNASIIALEAFFGEAFTYAMQEAPRIGFCTLELVFTKQNRLAIAKLQIDSPSTPPLLKRASAFILKGVDIEP